MCELLKFCVYKIPATRGLQRYKAKRFGQTYLRLTYLQTYLLTEWFIEQLKMVTQATESVIKGQKGSRIFSDT